MQISVIIPVYNAAPYVRHAVESALAQPETAEVVLVEDGSPDDSLRMCNELASKYESVRLLRHPNGENRGAAASRNLGIRESQYDVIAFLDADDFYTPNRFRVSGRILAEQPEIDGVYEAAQAYYEDKAARERWEALYHDYTISAFPAKVPPEDLFKTMLTGSVRGGVILLIGIVVRKQALLEVGLFSEKLRVGQDTVMIRKLAATKSLIGGLMDSPAVMFRVHAQNRVTGVPKITLEKQASRMTSWLDVWLWGRGVLNPAQKQTMVDTLMRYMRGDSVRGRILDRILAAFQRRVLLTRALIAAPELARYPRFWRYYVPNLKFIPYRLNQVRLRLLGRSQSTQ